MEWRASDPHLWIGPGEHGDRVKDEKGQVPVELVLMEDGGPSLRPPLHLLFADKEATRGEIIVPFDEIAQIQLANMSR